MTPNFVVVIIVLLPICCHIGLGMPYLCIFVEEVVIDQMQFLINGCEHQSVVKIRTQVMTK